LADAVLAGVKPAAAVPVARRRGTAARAVGFRGETEVVRRLADSDELTLYRPFPDLETAEVAAQHETTRRVLGIQVKTIGVDKRHPHNTVDIDLASLGRLDPYRRPLGDLGAIVQTELSRRRPS
jgi:hypothetical protein